MTTSFPTSLDNFTNPTGTDALESAAVPHATQHANINDAVEALETKVGVDGSAVTTSHTYKIAALETATSGYALKADPLSQFAATTSAQLAGVISDETGTGSLVFSNSPTLVTPALGDATATTLDTTGAVGVGTMSPTGSFEVAAIASNPGTVAVSGTGVTGTGTSFTKTFAPGQSIATTTTSGSETKEIQSITSDTVMTVVSAFAGTNSGASYTSMNSGSQFTILPNGCIRGYGSSGSSSAAINDWILKNNTVTQTSNQQNTAFRDQTVINQTSGTAGNVNTFVALTNINGTGGGAFGPVRGFNSAPTVASTNTGNISTLASFLAATQVQSGATGTITNFIGYGFNPTDASSTNTVTNMYGVQVAPTKNAGTLTSYAGIAIAAKPTAATNSSLLLLGTTTIPSGNFGIYNSSSNFNYLEGSLGIGAIPIAGNNLYLNKNLTGNVNSTNVRNQSIVQADVTNTVFSFDNVAQTAVAAFTLGQYIHYNAQQATIGAGSAITTQTGFNAGATLTGATNNFGFRGQIPSGSGRYNLYMEGTADNYLAGSLGIGILPVATTNVYMAKNIAGGATAYGFLQQAQVQSGTVTTSASYFHTVASTSAGTTSNVLHYETQQGTFTGAVSNQIGYRANSSLVGATNNYGFYGDIASGTGRYNLYMNGTAANYFAGDLQLGKTVTSGGTTGARTINKTAGTVNFAAAATSLVVTNSLVTANSVILCTVGTNDATMKSANAVAGAGSFTINANVAATAETRVNFVVFN